MRQEIISGIAPHRRSDMGLISFDKVLPMIHIVYILAHMAAQMKHGVISWFTALPKGHIVSFPGSCRCANETSFCL